MARSPLRFLAGLVTLIVFICQLSAQTTATWNNTGGGSWTTTANWTGLIGGDTYPDTGKVGSPYDASFPSLGGFSYTVDVPLSINLNKLTISDNNAIITQSAGTMTTTAGGNINAGIFRVDAGADIAGAAWTVGSGGPSFARLAFNRTATLTTDVTLQSFGRLSVEGNNKLTIDTGKTVKYLGSGAGVSAIESNQLIAGVGELENKGSILFDAGSSGTNFLDIRIQGKLTSSGTIQANVAGSTLTIESGLNANQGFDNSGSLKALNGGTLNILHKGTFTNTGTLVVGAGSVLQIGAGQVGDFTTAAIDGKISRPDGPNTGSVLLGGTMDNTAGLVLSTANTGTLKLVLGGTISGGSLSKDATGAFLQASSGALNGVTVGSFDVLDLMPNFSSLEFKGGTSISGSPGTIELGVGSNLSFAQDYSQAFSYRLRDSSGLALVTLNTFTVASGQSVRYLSAAGPGNFANLSGPGNIVNNGTLEFDPLSAAGATLNISPTGNFTNTGTIKAVGGNVSITPTGTFTNNGGAGSLEVDANHWLAIGGNFTTADISGKISRPSGTDGKMYIAGTMDNSAGLVLSTTNTGTLILGNPDGGINGGTISGGSLTKDATNARLQFTDQLNNILHNVTIGAGVLDLSADNSWSRVRGTTVLPDASYSMGTNTKLGFEQTTTLNGYTFTLGHNGVFSVEGDHTLTIGSSTVVEFLGPGTPAAGAQITAQHLGGTGADSTLINEGTIRFAAGTTGLNPVLTITNSTVGGITNKGLIDSNYAGGELTLFDLSDPIENTSTGTIRATSGGTLRGEGLGIANAGTIQVGGGSTFRGIITNNTGGKIVPGTSAGIFLIDGPLSSLTFDSGSIYAWELAALTTAGPGTNWDQIVMEDSSDLTIDPSAILEISFIGTATAPNLGDPFWDSPHTWKNIIFTPTAFAGNGSFTINNSAWAGIGYFSTINDPDPGVTLLWTLGPQPVPEPGSLLLCGAAAVGGAYGWWRKRRLPST